MYSKLNPNKRCKMSKKLSGAAVRKLAKESNAAHEALLTKVPKLTNFFTSTSSSVVPASNMSSDSEFPNNSVSEYTPICNQVLEVTNDASGDYDFDKQNSQDLSLNKPLHNLKPTSAEGSNTLIDFTPNSESLLSNDPSTWPVQLNVRETDAIVLMDPISFLKNDKEYPRTEKRHFSNDFLYRLAENGERVKRRWLIYSLLSNASFCLPCRLFDANPKSNFARKEGFNNWKKFNERASMHETSPGHFDCVQKWIEVERRLKQNKAIDQELIFQINTETQRWKNVLTRIVAIIMFLAENNIAFRGSSSKLFTKNNGNFLGLVQLLGQFDPVMMEHLRRITAKEHHAQMFSANIQNEIISLLAKQVKEAIITKIKFAKYFSIIMDCTPDVSHKEQTSLTIRYVHEDEINDEVVIQESFIGYAVAVESTGEALSNLLNQEIESCGLDLKNCRGQGYDNGANMAGIQKGVQARISANYPLASYTPCGCHSLNLVVSDGAKTSVKSTLLFGVLQRIYTIFAASPKRWCIISDHVESLTLKQVCETRWEARIHSISAIRHQYDSILKALDELNENTNDPTISSEAKSLQMHMEDFSFLVCLVVWHDILFEINLVSKILQGKDADISLASNQLQKCIAFIEKFRDRGLAESMSKAKEIAAECDIDPVFDQKRLRKKKKLFSYESGDSYNPTPEDLFKRDVFFPLIDTIMASLKQRMDQFSDHKSKWGFLYDLKHLPEKEALKDYCKNLEKHLTAEGVSDINGTELYNELLHVDAISSEKANEKQLPPLEALQIIKKTDRKDLFINLWISLRILLTIPVTVASCERSFSKLKLINTYLRSTMSQGRLLL